MPILFGALSAFTVLLGTALACRAPAYPKHQSRLEFWAGTLLVIGFALLALTLWSIFGAR